MAAITLKGLKKSYGQAHVIKGVDITIEDGEFVVFVGPSGCGKSTLLRMIAGLEDITGGTLTIGDKVVNDLPPKDRGVAMVFQSYAIFPHMTVRENVAFGLTISGASKEEKDAKVAEAARILQMEHLLDRRPSQLSGGQRQRVALARAIAVGPRVLVCDEPVSALDTHTADLVLDLLDGLVQGGLALVLITHDLRAAARISDDLLVLDAGRVAAYGPTAQLLAAPPIGVAAALVAASGLA